MKRSLIVLALACVCVSVAGQTPSALASIVSSANKHRNAIHNGADYRRIDPTDVVAVADNLIQYQNSDGGWPLDIDWLDASPTDSVLMGLKPEKRISSLENRATNMQVLFLAHAYEVAHVERFKVAALKGLDFIFGSQMPNGGWRDSRFDAVAFNFYVMSETLNVLRLASFAHEPFAWIDSITSRRAKSAFDSALGLVLNTQLCDKYGNLTGWCHHYDKVSLQACSGKVYDQPCVSPAETVRILDALMAVPNPSESVRRAIESSYNWLVRANLKNPDNASLANAFGIDGGGSQFVWARSYSIDSNEVFFVNDDGSRVKDLSELDFERMLKIGWFGGWNQDVLRRYDEWKARL